MDKKNLIPFLFCTMQMLGWSGVGAETWIDEVGRRVEVRPQPMRIVSLAPNITEILFALDLADRVVGVSSYCNYPPEAMKKEKVGGYINPSLEKILSLKPDLVIGTADGDLKPFVHKMAALGIPVYIVNPTHIEEVVRSIVHIGQLTSAVPSANRLRASMERRMQRVQEAVKGRPRPRVLHVLSFEPLMSSGKGSWVHDLIERSGGQNVIEGLKARHPRISMEEVIRKDPQVILLTGMVLKDPLAEQRKWWERWKEISAVRMGRVYHLEPDLILRPSPRIVEGLEAMARVIHPEAYENPGAEGSRVQGERRDR